MFFGYNYICFLKVVLVDICIEDYSMIKEYNLRCNKYFIKLCKFIFLDIYDDMEL